ncbi:hypothetical protein R1flu_026612 [Riccia fluitans]|uniref:Uncharacterized protein n=1 Tax=Riccia fluitans TaxID=41844 RepID=A0ABD1XH17_9MARC
MRGGHGQSELGLAVHALTPQHYGKFKSRVTIRNVLPFAHGFHSGVSRILVENFYHSVKRNSIWTNPLRFIIQAFTRLVT